jgi:DNA invertase Pin-like site-specific DNA recombinase
MGQTCIIYCLSQNGEAERLRSIAETRGWTVTAIFTDSPATAHDQRSGHAAMRRMVTKGRVSAILVSELAILGAGLDGPDGLVAFIAKLVDTEVDLIVEAEGIDTTLPAGKAWAATVASLHSYSKAQRQARVRAGQQRARLSGTPWGRPKIADGVLQGVRAALAAGHGVRPTARKMGISPARVAAEKQAMRVAETAGSGCLPKRQLECSESLPR